MNKFESVKGILDNIDKWERDRESLDNRVIADLGSRLSEIKKLCVGHGDDVHFRLIQKICDEGLDAIVQRANGV
jgi:hypothetical protein